ncbi:MAG: dipeptidase [Acidobacteriota bacterium]|nr:dipeptidase [Acidobacteriota bacterium]
MTRKTLLLLLLAAGLIGGWSYAYYQTIRMDREMNAVLQRPPYSVSPAAEALHQRLLIADMHADSLLWDRGLAHRSTRGQLDVPRMIEANQALQFFTVVTQSPKHLNLERNTADTDELTLAYVVRLKPPSTWFSRTARALEQAAELRSASRHSGGRLVLVRSRGELTSFLERWQSDRHLVAGILGIEGAHALDGKLGNLDALDHAGFRMIGLAHFFDNEFAGSAHGARKYGLTEPGRALVREMERRKILVDLAHASAQTIDDVTAMATRPVVVSHTGVRGTCDNQRNLSDAQLKKIAATGGVIGIGFWDVATCGNDARAIVRAIRYAAGVVGADHVALGSDFDGAVVEPFDVTGLPLITQELMQQGFTEPEIAKIMGGNVFRLLRETLPEQ